MPCRYDETPQEIAQRQALRDAERQRQIENNYIKPLNKLTAENDMLREELLRIAKQYPDVTMSPDLYKFVRDNQTKHRREDLKRLKKTFSDSKDATRLGKVMLADPKKPLKEQLGFDPDDF